MGKVTCFYLSVTFLVYLSGIIFTINRINDDLISMSLSLTYIIIDAIVLFYIIYRIFNIKKIHHITVFIKCLIMIWNIAYFCVIIGLAVKYDKTSKVKVLSQAQLRTFLFYELIAMLKLYFHIISLIRNKNKCCTDNSQNRNDENCWQEIIIKDENEDLYYNERRLEKVKKENRNLETENKRLKEEKIKADDNMIRNKKIEIIIKYINSKYNANFSKDLLYTKLLFEIKNKCGLIIDKNKYEEIIINYIKQNVFKFLKCPLTNKFFDNPYITPDGQTFEENIIKKKGKNPITNKKLKTGELIKNKLVLDIIEIINNYEYDFNIQHFKEIKEKLVSKTTKKLYQNPYVISSGDNKGDTVEENEIFPQPTKYPNLVIKNIIENNLELFDDAFLQFDMKLDEDYISKNDVIKYKTRNNIDSESIHDAKRELPSNGK